MPDNQQSQGLPWWVAGGGNTGDTGVIPGAGSYNNEGNNLGAILGMAGTPDNVYFGGGPNAAAEATNYYVGLANQAQNNTAARVDPESLGMARQFGGQSQNAYNQAMGANMGAQAQQNAALGNLANAAAGKGPSAAQAQLQAGTDAAINANMAMANSARGQAGLANAQKNALVQNGMQTQQAANQSAQLRAQEMQAAQSQYMQAANQMQNQYAAQQAGYGGQQLQNMGLVNQYGFQNAQLQAQQNALNQQGALAYQQLGFNAQAEQLQAMEANQQVNSQTNLANAKNVSSGVGGILGAAAGAMAFMSDERVKKDVKDGGPSIDEALSKMQPHSFQYADAHFGSPGEHQGVMAQELLGSDAGRRLVIQDPQTKALAVKVPEAASFLLGAVSRLNERLEHLEGGKRVGESKLEEPHGGESAWTLREEPNFLLAKNDRTGELSKVATEPLSRDERAEAMAPHGAGPISRHGDMPIVGSLLGGGGSSQPAPPPTTTPDAAVSPAMMNANGIKGDPMQQKMGMPGNDSSGGLGGGFSSGFNSSMGTANMLNSAASGMWGGGI